MSDPQSLLDFENVDDYPYDAFIPKLQDFEPDEESPDTTKRAYEITKKTTLKLYEEYMALLDIYKEENEKMLRNEQEFKDQLEYMENKLRKYQQNPNMETIDNEVRLEELEQRNRELRSELDNLQFRFDQEKSEKDKLKNQNEELGKRIRKLTDDVDKYREMVREYESKKKMQYLDQSERTKTEQGLNNEKIKKLNKQIYDLLNDNNRLEEENNRLNSVIEGEKTSVKEAIDQMNNIRKEIETLNDLKIQKDLEIKELYELNSKLKFQIDELNSKLLISQNQDVVVADAQNKIIHLQSENQDLKKLLEMSRREDPFRRDDKLTSRLQIELNKAISDLKKKDQELEILKKEYQDFTKEMDKNAAVMDDLKKTVNQNSKNLSTNNQYNITKQYEQKISFYENRLKESETRLREFEDQAALKEKELVEALTRIREYESGDYQLQQAVNEIKALKTQIKVRDRDIENLVKNLNKLDVTLNEVLEENDDLRAKLGMGPKEKLNLDELNNIRAIRAQENRVQIYVLQRENENLIETQNQLRNQIRRLAKQIRSKEIVASILEDDTDYYDMIESKLAGKNGPTGKQVDAMDPKTVKEFETMKKRNEHLLQILFEFEQENKSLEACFIELDAKIKNVNVTNASMAKNKSKETVIKCPSLEKLLSEFETQRAMRSSVKNYSFLNKLLGESNADQITLALKSEIDFLQGRNEELRSHISSLKNDMNKSQAALIKAQDEIDRLNSDVRYMNVNSSAKDIFHPFKLPAGMTPSSQDIISALNEYLIDTLQELEEYKKLGTMAEKELESLKRKYAVARHQISILYRDYIDETKSWKDEKETLTKTIKKLNDTIAVDSVKLQEYDRLLDVLQRDEPEIRRAIAENSRQMHLTRTSEKQLQRKCLAIEEINTHIVKENKKMKVDMIDMEIAVQQRVGYLERYKDLANFRIMSLQKQLEESVPVVKLDKVNKDYDEVVQNYRQLLDKQEKNEHLTTSLHQTEQLNKKYENEIEFLKKELETQIDRANIYQETLNRMKNLTIPPVLGAGDVRTDLGAIEHDNSLQSMAKRLTALEMKELNERQKADHAQRMYDQQRNLIRQVENRNIELENNFTELSKKYLTLEKSEHQLREQLTQFVPKTVNDHDKARIVELEKQEMLLKLEVSRLRELTEITLYQTASLEFINNISKVQMENFGLIDIQTLTDETDSLGRINRQLILMQISEATAVRKLQHAQGRCKKLEAQLIRAEQKYDRENLDFFTSKKDYISKISYLRSTVQDLRHKYAGSIPLKQQEKFNAAKEQIAQVKKEINEKLLRINDEKYQLEDRLAEYNARLQEIELLKNAAVVGKDGSVKFNQKFLDSFKKSENIKMLNLKLDRANRRLKDEMKFLEEINRKHEIAIIALEEENLRLESDFDQKLLIWEHREADLERTVEHLRKQHQMIESLAISFEEISGNMPDQTLPIANQLDQAMNIIRSHIKLLAEAKVQADLSKKRIDDLEKQSRKLETEVNIRDKVIAELRLRLPATADRDLIIKTTMTSSSSTDATSATPVKAAQATIESLQNRMKQKDETIVKYQDMLKLAREEINKINKQHEIELNNLIDKLNLTRDTNIEKLREELRSSNVHGHTVMTKAQLNKLQELEEVTVEQDNTISALNQKIRHLNTEIDTWKARHEMIRQQSAQDLANAQNEQLANMERLNSEMEAYRQKVAEKENEINGVINELENQKQLNSKSPSAEMKALVDRLKNQLHEKEEQQRKLNEALSNIRGDMVDLARNNVASLSEEKTQEKRIKDIIEKTSGEYQDKIYRLSEELSKLRKDLKDAAKSNDELKLELEQLKSQMKTKDQKMKKLTEENKKFTDDANLQSSGKIGKSFVNNPSEVENLKRQIRLLEQKVRNQRPEKPLSETKSPSKSDEKLAKSIDESGNDVSSLKYQIDQWKTRYNYVLSENAILNRQKYDLDIEVARLKRELDINGLKVLAENKQLREEMDKLKTTRVRNYSPNNAKAANDLRAENKNQLLAELQRLTDENNKLRERASKVDELQRYVDVLRMENDKYRNDDAQSTSSSTSSIRRIGESGKSTKELEKTIALMKKIIVKLQGENENLKNGVK